MLPFPATVWAEGGQFNGPPFPATASAEGAQLNVPPSSTHGCLGSEKSNFCAVHRRCLVRPGAAEGRCLTPLMPRGRGAVAGLRASDGRGHARTDAGSSQEKKSRVRSCLALGSMCAYTVRPSVHVRFLTTWQRMPMRKQRQRVVEAGDEVLPVAEQCSSLAVSSSHRPGQTHLRSSPPTMDDKAIPVWVRRASRLSR
jgi:hypothetical protein